MKEAWLPVVDWPYEVSNHGRVRNSRTGRLLKLIPHKSGYLNVQLWCKMKYRTFLVHRLVANAFLGPAPSDEHEVAHGDANMHNNRASNLRWALHAEIMRDRDRHGRTARGHRNGKKKHDSATVVKVREMYASGMMPSAIARELGLKKGAVSGYVYRERRQVILQEDLDHAPAIENL